MTSSVHPGLSIALAIALAAAVAACGERSDDTNASRRPDGSASRAASSGREARDGARSAVDIPRNRQADASAGSAGSASTGAMGAAGEPRDKVPGSSSGEPRSEDAKLTAMVLAGLKADRELNPLRIDVDTREGIVTLSGSVPSAAAKARASEIAQNVRNVKSVNNQLTLAAG